MPDAASGLPIGTVTFLRTDVEGSMRLARSQGSAWDDLNAMQLAIVRRAVGGHGGVVVRTEGDAVFAVFPEAGSAAIAAIGLQRAMLDHAWPADAPVSVRVGLHSGEAHLAGDDYGGFDVNRAARIAAVGHGGQIVLSDPTRALIEADLPEGVSVRDLGRHALKDVPNPERLFQLVAPGLRTDFPPIRTGSTAAGNLPPRLTSFVARDAELATIADLLATTRLVTITGPGGMGKSSLATEAARAAADGCPDGAWWVALDGVADPDLVPAAIARVLGVYDGPSSPVIERLERYLADRRALLVLDNFEHLLPAAPLVGDLLRAAPELRVIATSRAPLHVTGEQEFPLGPLAGAGGKVESAMPASRSAAAGLFVDRARSVDPAWDPGADEPVVEEICGLVDGLPLGIELAAARVSMLPPAMIRDRLAAQLPLPGSGPRDVPARQRTLDGTIAWSYDLLPHSRRRLLRELTVFEGGFDLEQAGPVATLDPGDDLMDAVYELVDQSLVVRSAIAGGHGALGSVRFRLLETIRSYALRQLRDHGDEADVRHRHALAMLELAETAAQYMPSNDQVRWLDRLALDHANLGAALRFAIHSGEVDVAQRLSWSTWRYWQLGGHLNEGRELADAVVDIPRADEPSPGRMWSLAAAGGLAYWQAETARADELYVAQLETSLQIGDRAGEADANYNLAATRSIAGDMEAGLRLISRARELYAELGDTVGHDRTDWSLANLMVLSGETEEGLRLIFEALQRYEENGDAMYEALAAGSIAFFHQRMGNIPEAIRYGIGSIQLTYALRDVATATITLADGAILLVEVGLPEEAAVLLGAYHALCDVHGVQPPAGIGRLISWSGVEERTIAALSEETYADATRRGAAMSLDEAIAYAVETLGPYAAEPPDDGASVQSRSE
jgi:predicted ATPase/class 3 adenylate cyclase